MVAPVPPARLLLDTSAAIGLLEFSGRTDLLALLGSAGFEIEVAPQVLAELSAGPQGKGREPKQDWVQIEPDAAVLVLLRERFPLLGAGELAVLTRGQALHGKQPYFVVLDDKRARGTAVELGLAMTGTLGLLFCLEQKGLISGSDAAAIRRSLREAGFRIPEGA